MTELPTGTVTFLFADLEGSTRLWEDHPDAMRGALARHDEILRESITGHGGWVVKSTGDGALAVFATAQAAVDAAVAVQRGLGAATWGSTGPLRVRMGLHTGASEFRDGDYYGPAVNRAARLMAAAHGGQVVVSHATEELARDATVDGVSLVDLGEHRLRDLARPERVFQVVAEGLVREFPGLGSLESVPGNLPVQISSFVGREDDIAGVAALVRGGPLVTLIGVGGVGKTRLSLQIAAELATGFSDGAWFCDLASVTEDDGVAFAVANVFGIVPRAGVASLEAVVEFLRGKQLLLVLDNCEHLVDGVGLFVEHLVRADPQVRVIATSREALAVEGERLWPVRPLSVPASAMEPEVEVSAPVRLFLDRATGLRPTFQLDSSNLGAVLEICRRVDGIPLAIELAAARIAALSPAEIANRLDRRFALLTGGRRGGVPRHETLRAAIDWSFDLLDDAERLTLQRASVFVGGFTLAGIEGVAEDAPELGETIDVVGRLVDKSLLIADDEGETTRYRLLETIRQYALEHLDASGDTEDVRTRHLRYFVEFAAQAGPALMSADELTWEARTRPEIENLRAAMAWAIETEDPAAALQLAAPFSGQWHARHPFGLSRLGDLASATPGADSHPLYPVVLGMAAEYLRSRGEQDRATELANQALRLANEPDNPARCLAECVLGNLSLWNARDDPAEHFERAAASARLAGNLPMLALSQALFAVALPSRGSQSLDEALQAAEDGLRLSRETGVPSVIANGNFALGYVLVQRHDPAALQPLLAAVEQTSDFNRSGVLGVLALHQLRHGTTAEAVDAIEAAIRDSVYRGDPSNTSTTIDLALPILIRCQDPTTAAELYGSLGGGLPEVIRAGMPAQRRRTVTDALRKTLGADEFAQAAARGAAMSYDEVIAHALDRITRLRDNLA